MPAFPFKNLGAIPYQRTGKELRVAQAAAPAPQTYSDPTFFNTPILMQALSPECGGFSLAFAIAYLLKLQQPLSGSFAYAYEKTVDGLPNDEGTLITALYTTAAKAGTCLKELFPDDGDTTVDPTGKQTPYSAATPQAIQDALARAGWLCLFVNDLSWAGLQSAIAQYGTVIVEAEVGDEWWTSQYGKVQPVGDNSWAAADILPLVPPKTVVSAHFFALGGVYNPEQIFFANSWSTEWGQNGFGYFGQNYVPFIKNAIVLYKMPPSVQTVVNHPTLTEPEKLSIIQQIIDDIAQEVALIKQEIGTK